jgi:hypothetical protein
MNRRRTIQLLIGLLLVCFYTASYSLLLQQRNEKRQDARSGSGIWNLPPVALLALAGEFKGLMADYLTMEVGAQLGTELKRTPDGGFIVVKKQYDWQSINRLFKASQTLDPSFAQTYIVAQGWLPWEPANMVAEAQDILKVAARNRPWDWEPIRSMGFNTYYFLKQSGEASKKFFEAAKIPNAPPFLSIIGSRLAQKGGETQTAIYIMKSMLLDKDQKDPDYNTISDRLKALEGVVILEKGISDYQHTFGSIPQSTDQLLTSGILKSLPENPYKVDYCIDNQGTIHYDNPHCRN